MSVKFDDLFLQPEWLKRNFSYLSIILPLDFSEILNVSKIAAHLMFQLISGCDVIKFLNHKSEK